MRPIFLCVLVVLAGPASVGAAQEIGSYSLDVMLDPDARRMEVRGSFRIEGSADRRVTFLLSPRMVNLEAWFESPDIAVVELRSEEEGGDRRWTLVADRAVPANQVLFFSYRSDGEVAPQLAIRPTGSFAGGGGELWYPQASFKRRDTGTLRFRVPRGTSVVATGLLQKQEERPTTTTFEFRVEYPSKFAFAAGEYAVHRRAGRPALGLYLLSDRSVAEDFLGRAAAALDVLRGMFGELPYDELRLVEVDFPGKIIGTSEFGLIFVDDSKLGEFDLAYVAHEMGHQWWGNIVRSAGGTPGQMLLSEGITQLGALWSVEEAEGRAAAEAFRRSGHPPGNGQSATSYFELVQSGIDMPLTLDVPASQEEILTMHRLANSKGFLVLDLLARTIGREKFAAILRVFVDEYRDRLTSWPELEATIQARAGIDLRWFFAQWTEREGAPYYHLRWRRTANGVAGVIAQPPPHYRASLPVVLQGSGGETLVRTVEAAGSETVFQFDAPFTVERVTLDPRYEVLRWVTGLP